MIDYIDEVEIIQIEDVPEIAKTSKSRAMLQETAILFDGPRGSGKTSTACYYEAGRASDGIEVFSNLPIDFVFEDVGKVKTMPLSALQLYDFGKSLKVGCDFFLDEFDKLCSARWSMSNANRLLSWLATQMRKLSATFVFTSQRMRYIDVMWRDQIDVVVKCQDLAHTPWGKEQNLERGEMIHLACYDWSGIITGRDYFASPYPYAQFRLNNKYIWGLYDTRQLLGIEEMLRSFKFDRQTMMVGADGITEWSSKSKKEINTDFNHYTDQDEYVMSLFHDMALQGAVDVPKPIIFDELRRNGINLSDNQLVAIVRKYKLKSESKYVKGKKVPYYKLGEYFGAGNFGEEPALMGATEV